MVTLEQLLDKIADELILDETGIITPAIVKQNQKTINDGLIKIGCFIVDASLTTRHSI